MDSGVSKIHGETRPVKQAVRKTAVGKAIQYQSEKQRLKLEAIQKANLKTKDDLDNDDSWESAEEDAPVIRLEDLLSNMKIDGDEEEDEEEEKEDDEE